MNFLSKSTRNVTLGGILLAVLVMLSACDMPRIPLFEIAGTTMGTTYRIKVIHAGFDVEDVSDAVEQRLREINRVFSTYIPDSEISQLNKNLSAGPIPVSEEMMRLLTLSRTLHELTDGAFDVTVAPLVNLWGFGPEGPADGVPSEADIDAARAMTGFDRVVLGDNQVTRPPGLMIDLSAVAKGYGVDEVARLLEARGVERYMVEIGGEVRTAGRNQRNKEWRIGIEVPDRESRKVKRALPLRGLGMATSGDYRNYFEHKGVNYSHTIDPQTGWPVTHNMASVTVLHPEAAFADGIATGFSVLGIERTIAIADAQNLPVLAIIRDETGYREVTSSTMEKYLYPHD